MYYKMKTVHSADLSDTVGKILAKIAEVWLSKKMSLQVR
jgi:hypothetical protein